MKSAKLKAKLEALQAELSNAIKKREALEVELSRIGARIEQLRRTWGGGGEIEKCRKALDAALRMEADRKKRRVTIGDFWGGEFVVAKVTPKRIYLRNPGSANSEQFYHSGERVGYGDPIPPEDVKWILAEAEQVRAAR